jgi:hypothetical protein
VKYRENSKITNSRASQQALEEESKKEEKER